MAAREKRSKKRSGTKLSPEKRLESFVFFVDRSLGKNIVPDALVKAGVAAFFLTSASATGEENANSIIKGLSKIAHLLEHQRRPFIAKINKDGKVELWLDHKGKNRLKRSKK
jgi:hypothetical protein